MSLVLKHLQKQKSVITIIGPFAWMRSSDQMILQFPLSSFRTSARKNLDNGENLEGWEGLK